MEKLAANRWVQIVILLAVLLSAVGFSFSNARWRQQIRNFTFDNYNILKPRAASGDVVIVDIDEASLKEIGQMPWPRTVMADLTEKLKAMGAAVIVFDMVFPEPDRNSPNHLARVFEGMVGFADLKDRFATLPDNDARFGLAIGEAGNVVTGFSMTNEQTDSSPKQIAIFRGKDMERFVPVLQGATVNQKSIDNMAAGNGSFFVSTDTDGIIRRVPMLVGHKRAGSDIVSVFPSLSLETVRVLDGQKGGRVILADPRYAALDPERFGIEGVEVGKGGRIIPTTARGEFIVYFARSKPDWYLPAHKVLDGTLDPAEVKGKIVFVGTSAVGLKDIRSTPLDTFIPGVEVHLNIVDQILQEVFLRRPIEAEGLEAIAILLTGVAIIAFSPFIGAVAQAVAVTAAVAGWIYAGWYAFSQHGFLIDVTWPALSILLIFMLSVVFTYIRTENERRRVRQAFGLYISPDFMKELTANPDRLRLGGEIRDLSVMFTDIRSFTTISEGLTPEELINLMNDFLTPMSDLVMQNRGTIDKYMGDAMMAFWNAPLDDPDHAAHACRAALGMQAALTPINEAVRIKALELGKKPVLLNAGIGINTGPCAVGNMGSRQRFAYSALGDAVNLASRLEGQTKTYGINILLGEETFVKAPAMAALEIDLIKVKGKTKPVRVYALLGDETMAARDDFKVWRARHDNMLERYRARDFMDAASIADECSALATMPMDTLYGLYRERALEMIKNPPDAEWDGAYEAQTK